MTTDTEMSWEKIRTSVDWVPAKPEKVIELWKRVMGEGTRVRKEKYVNVEGVLMPEGEMVTGKFKVLASEEGSLISWKTDGGDEKYIPINTSTFFVGVQEHESGDRSFVMLHSRQSGGRDRQTVRRFTPVKE